METIAAQKRPAAEKSCDSPYRTTPEVMVVDDHPMNRFVVAEMLAALGAHATCAGDGHHAIELARTRPFVLILMDLQMPGMDGYQTTRALRALPDLKLPPVVGLTASLLSDDPEQHRSAGLDGCISKPLRPEDLARLLNHRCEPLTNSETRTAVTRLLHVDWQQCVQVAGGREVLASELLIIMLETLAPSVHDIRQAISEQHWEALADALHRLLGACRYTGAPRLTELCGLLQRDCNRQDHAAMLEWLPVLEQAAEDFAIAAGDVLARLRSEEAPESVPVRPRLSPAPQTPARAPAHR